MPQRLEPPFEQEFRFLFFGGNETDRVLIQPGRRRIRFDICVEAVLVFCFDKFFNGVRRRVH
jgi:hypothetical protein